MEQLSFLERLLGTSDIVGFFLFAFFAVLGICLASWMGVGTRQKTSERTPIAFSWKVFWNDNWRKWGASLILVFAYLRFSENLTGLQLNEFYAFCVGMSLDLLMLVVKKKTMIFDMKDKT